MTAEKKIKFLITILEQVNACLEEGAIEDVWSYYDIFCVAWGRLRWGIADTTSGASELLGLIKDTQDNLKKNGAKHRIRVH